LLIVACVLTPLSVLAVWTKNTLLDTDQYVSTVAPLASATADLAVKYPERVTADGTHIRLRVKNALPAAGRFHRARRAPAETVTTDSSGS
jgi:hypothetical protein